MLYIRSYPLGMRRLVRARQRARRIESRLEWLIAGLCLYTGIMLIEVLKGYLYLLGNIQGSFF